MAALANPRKGKSLQQMKQSSKQNMLASNKAITASAVKMTAGGGGGLAQRSELFDEDWSKERVVQKPKDQLQLSEQQLKEEITRVLTANNPHAPDNIVRFAFKDRAFRQTSSVDQLAVHYALHSNLLHRESDEAVRQLESTDGAAASAPTSDSATSPEAGVESESRADGEGSGAGGGEGGEGGGGDEVATKAEEPSAAQGAKKLMNQFNFSERATQTLNNPHRAIGTMTEPPPRAGFSANANQWEIHDAYVEELERQQREKDAKEKKKPKDDGKRRKTGQQADGQTSVSGSGQDEAWLMGLPALSEKVHILYRMVNQNTFDDVMQDFKYYEDPSDEYRQQQGTLLPLWRFSYDRAKRSAVTALSISPQYPDLIAVGYGSYNFSKPTTGMLCFYTMKNPSVPEFVFILDSGIMCLDLHPEQAHLAAIGLYSGAVAVVDVRKPASTQPAYLSTAATGKHTDPVWQVRWQADDPEQRHNFFSVASDGYVMRWTLCKNQLVPMKVIALQMDSSAAVGPSGTHLKQLGCGTCIDFRHGAEHIYLVGTEEGIIHKCSKTFSVKALDSFRAHQVAIYAVRWNSFHERIFATCSADWMVKIWDEDHLEKPLFVFDLNNAVSDVAWSPYSATVFAAATVDGKVGLTCSCTFSFLHLRSRCVAVSLCRCL